MRCILNRVLLLLVFAAMLSTLSGIQVPEQRGKAVSDINYSNVQQKDKNKDDSSRAEYAAIIKPNRILQERFGVIPKLQSNSGGETNYSFAWSTLAPTLNTTTVEWIESDWYGTDDDDGNDLHGTYPSGGERYDVEAMYFDNDNDSIYIAIITSVPHKNTNADGVKSVGVYDDRHQVWVRPGDLSLDLGLGEARIEKNGTSWHYDYGLDLVHELRDSTLIQNNFVTSKMRNNNLGHQLYKTSSDVGSATSDNLDPAAGESDWHTSMRVGATDGYWEHTNFDNSSTRKTDSIVRVGNQAAGIITKYYKLKFEGGKKENGQFTYVIEVTIPRELLGDDNPSHGEEIGMRWTPGCRNDGNSNTAIVKLFGVIDETTSIGDKVWNDVQLDFIQQDYEPGVEGVTVNLYDDSNTILQSTTTDGNGDYLFDNLTPGTYYLEFEIGASWELCIPDIGDDVSDSDVNPQTRQTVPYTLSGNSGNLTVDCGVYSSDPLPVELNIFNATFNNYQANIQWTTQTESNNAFWNVYRATSSNVGQASLISFTSIEGAGNSSVPTDYSYHDSALLDFIEEQNLQNPTLWYWLESVSYDGESQLHGPVSLVVPISGESVTPPEISSTFGISANYPNPFNPFTIIRFQVKESASASLEIYNVKGEKVKTLFQNRYIEADTICREKWEGRDSNGFTVSSGIYLSILKIKNRVYTRKMILQK